MSNPVIIVDEQKFGKLIRKIEVLTDEVKTLSAKSAPTLKDKWLVTDEVCKLLDISSRKLQQMRTNNEIKYTKSGKKIYYKASDVQNYLEECS